MALDLNKLTKEEVISFLMTASTDYRLKEFSFGWTSQPCTDENKIRLPDVLMRAIQFLDGSGSSNDLQIQVIDDIHRRFIIGTHWMFCGSTYKVVEHHPHGTVTFRSLASPETYIKYTGKQMLENVKAFRCVKDGSCFIEDIQNRFPIGSHWEGPLFGEPTHVYQVALHNSYTITFRDVDINALKSMHYTDFNDKIIASLKPREDLNGKTSLP